MSHPAHLGPALPGRPSSRRSKAAPGPRNAPPAPTPRPPAEPEFPRLPPARRLHHYFERQCDAAPEALALICGEERLDYAALDARANRLARHLAACGVRPGDRVGVLLERSVHTYTALLAVLKCGAAFVPLDPAFPADRVAFIAADAGFALLVSTTDLSGALAGLPCPVLALDTAAEAIARQSPERPDFPEPEDDLCYIIYTSGSTGRPKGVMVDHANVCHYLSVCTPLYNVSASDRVYQGLSISFDFSIEEIWSPFAAGATLIAGPTDHRRIGPGLAEFLIEQRVTMLFCVPTLLATLDRDVPALRTLVVGGEVFPADLVRRWWKPSRRLLNTYGPTETTVTATWTELTPGKPVTIGRPLPTYEVRILDESLRPVPPGEAGEICIGGPCVARGYVHLPELTAERFVSSGERGARNAERFYRTGDLGRLLSNGEVEFLGRIDDQVKVRGYRIELSEIEADLLACPEVASAVAAVFTPPGAAAPELAAYVTLVPGAGPADGLRKRLHAELCRRMPDYMVPAFIEVIDAIPTLPSGKADRKRLPPPASPRLGGRGGELVLPTTPLEKELAAAWCRILGREHVSVEDDFFLDLGGHSMLAALTVSELRHAPLFRSVSIADLYAHPTIRSLANHLQAQLVGVEDAREKESVEAPRPEARRYGSGRVWLCAAGQMALLYLAFAALSAPVALLLAGGVPQSLGQFLGFGVMAAGVVLLTALVLPVLAKWLLIGRFRAGRYPLWGWYYCRFWLVRKLLSAAPLGLLAGSPLLPLYARLLGARVGKRCHLAAARLELPDLIEIGDDASIGYGAELMPFAVEGGWLRLAPVRVGAGAFVGANALVMPGGTIGRGAVVLEHSLVPAGQTIPDGETWAGSPSARVEADPRLASMAERPAPGGWSPLLGLGFVLGFAVLEVLPLLMLLPGLLFVWAVADGELWRALAAAPVAGAMFVLTACALVAAGKWLVLPTVRPGVHPLRSGFGLRKWFADKLIVTSLTVTNTLYGTLYALPWLRLLGVRVGRRAEVSTVAHFDPGLLTLGPESFVADFAAVGAARYHNGHVELAPTELGRRCFVGNASSVPAGTRLADGSLLGVHSVPPAQPVEADTSWLGSPAIFLPRRQTYGAFGEAVTYAPPRRLVACRLAIEFFRVTLPATVAVALVVLGLWAVAALAASLSPLGLVAALPGLYFASAVAATLFTLALKWLVAGRYRPRVRPLWSAFVWRTELVTGLYENVAVPWLLRWLTGTALAGPALRLFGAKVGRRVWLDTTFVTEFDLVYIGDDAAVGTLTSLQTHLFEDRVMKMSALVVGAGCVVGPRSVILYDAALEDGAELDGLSLAMKGESLPAGGRWRGIPARRAEPDR